MQLKSRRTKVSKPERGQSLVELAISLMVILMLLMGLVDFGIAMFAYTAMRDAAQDGALYGSIEPADEMGIKNRVIAAASDVITVEVDDITVSYNTSSPIKYCEGSSGNPLTPNTLTVSIVHLHPVSTPLVGAMIGSQNITLRAQVTDTILLPVCQ